MKSNVGAVLAVLLLAGCGGGGISRIVPTGAQQVAGLERVPGDAESGSADATLFVSSSTSVYAYPVGASGPASGAAIFTPDATPAGSIVGIATSTDDNVEILQSYQNKTAGLGDCRIVEEPGNASGAATPPTNILDCEHNASNEAAVLMRGRAIARGPGGEFDAIATDNSDGDIIIRANFTPAAAQQSSYFYLPGPGGASHGIAEGSGGHIYVSSSSAGAPIVTGGNASTTGCSAGAPGNATIINIAPGASTALHTMTINGRTAAGAMALAPNQTTMYVATCDTAGELLLDEIATPGANGPTAPVATIGPFGAQSITALIVDNNGNVYVGLSAVGTAGTTNIRVYPPSAFSSTVPTKPTPLRILNNPLPVASGAKITSMALGDATVAPTGGIVADYAIPMSVGNSQPTAIVTGGDKNLWEINSSGSIGKLTTGGAFTLYQDPDISGAREIAVGSDGNIWYPDALSTQIARMKPDGTLTRFTPNNFTPSASGIAGGPDGNIWFGGVIQGTAETALAQMSTAGVVTNVYTVPGVGSIQSITTGSDGNLWFLAYDSSKSGGWVCQMTPSGAGPEYPITFDGADAQGNGSITSGPDGALWVADFGNSEVVRITTAGSVSYVPLGKGVQPIALASAKDGNVWFVAWGGRYGKITSSGVVTQFTLPGTYGIPYAMTGGPDGNLWVNSFLTAPGMVFAIHP
jgi:virginiamycin B lyase